MDYNGTMVEVIFPISSVQGDSVCANVTIIDDDALECEQNFTVFISSATLGTDISGQPQAVVSIMDNDGKCFDGKLCVFVINVNGKDLRIITRIILITILIDTLLQGSPYNHPLLWYCSSE